MIQLPPIPEGFSPALTRSYERAQAVITRLTPAIQHFPALHERFKHSIGMLNQASEAAGVPLRLYRARAVRAGLIERYQTVLMLSQDFEREQNPQRKELREKVLKDARGCFEHQRGHFHDDIRPLVELDLKRFAAALDAFVRDVELVMRWSVDPPIAKAGGGG